MVALGAASLVTLGAQLSPADASRIIQGIITGIGFLGGGIILREGGRIVGLTTAAGLWGVAAVGIVVGGGEYLIGVAVTLFILLVLTMDRLPVLSRLAHQGSRARRREEENVQEGKQ